MIKYNKLLIDGDYLTIDFEVLDKPYYKGTKILGVRIDTPLTYGTDTPYYIENEEDTSHFIKEIFIPDAKRELLIITPLMYVAFPLDAPCGSDIIDKAAVYDKRIFLDKGMMYLEELGDTCNIPKAFIDFILRHKALDMAIATCNYSTAIKYWKMLVVSSGAPLKRCGCHGKY